VGVLDDIIHGLITSNEVCDLANFLTSELSLETPALFWQRMVNPLQVVANLLDTLPDGGLLRLSIFKGRPSAG